MRWSFSPLRLFFGLFITICATAPASSQLSVFQTATLAQLHCPKDAVVWLDFTKRRYYTEGQRLYGKGRDGVFVCKEEARKGGYRRSRLGRR